MTGWRLGYAAGPEKILTQMLKIHQFAIMCAPTKAALRIVSYFCTIFQEKNTISYTFLQTYEYVLMPLCYYVCSYNKSVCRNRGDEKWR